MKILYFTNKDIIDSDVIPDILRKLGDEVFVYTSKIELDFIKKENIDFIVSDRSRFLIKKDVIQYLPKKIVNLHPSYLPWNKGYHPNYWSIKEKTPHGVTLHYIDENIDTGPIIAQTRIFYSPEDTLKVTYLRLRKLMVSLFEACWPEIREGRLFACAQNNAEGTLHFKKDFDNEYKKLVNGWDTKIEDILI